MSERIISYYDHAFIKVKDPKYSTNTWECLKCKHTSIFLLSFIEDEVKILTCNERIIKQILE